MHRYICIKACLLFNDIWNAGHFSDSSMFMPIKVNTHPINQSSNSYPPPSPPPPPSPHPSAPLPLPYGSSLSHDPKSCCHPTITVSGVSTDIHSWSTLILHPPPPSHPHPQPPPHPSTLKSVLCILMSTNFLSLWQQASKLTTLPSPLGMLQ